jgi:hypothetical protein
MREETAPAATLPEAPKVPSFPPGETQGPEEGERDKEPVMIEAKQGKLSTPFEINDSSEWKVYRSEKANFQIRYPAWLADPDLKSEGDNAISFWFPEQSDREPCCNVAISIQGDKYLYPPSGRRKPTSCQDLQPIKREGDTEVEIGGIRFIKREWGSDFISPLTGLRVVSKGIGYAGNHGGFCYSLHFDRSYEFARQYGAEDLTVALAKLDEEMRLFEQIHFDCLKINKSTEKFRQKGGDLSVESCNSELNVRLFSNCRF